jgi:hypothetical protein
MLILVEEDMRAVLVEHVFLPSQIKGLEARAWLLDDLELRRRGGAGAVATLEVDGDVTIRDLVRMERRLLPKTTNFTRGELGVRIHMEWDYLPYWVRDREELYAADR